MKVLMIGGTGLLGSAGAQALIGRGHQVKTLALPPVPVGADLPAEMDIILGNYMDLSDDELIEHLSGCEGLVFAAGVDERLEKPPPIKALFDRYNNTPLERLLRLAKGCGLRHVVICGSYFCHFDSVWPELQLAARHPYIKSRLEQEEIAFSFADESFSVAVLQIPYVFGAQPGRKPVWMFLVELIRAMPMATFYPRGGTAMISATQVGVAMAEALTATRGGQAWPLGCVNMTWQEMLTIFHNNMGMPRRPIITIPGWAFTLGARRRQRRLQRQGLETGLDYKHLADIMTRQAYIDPVQGCTKLNLPHEDMAQAIGQSVRQCMSILSGRSQAIGMKGE